MRQPLKRLFLILLAVLLPVLAFAQDRSTVSNYFVNGITTCSSTVTRVAPTSVGSRNFAVYNLSASRCYFGNANVTTANGVALCSATAVCPSTSQAFPVGNVSAEWMVAAVGTSITIHWNGGGY